ncbi:putative porin [Joostella atrarenae]|uniref:Porin n=1 Tax=Joostella atrarenae TaxID=679257 RepID=A0ABS9J2S4_9FLAO|nr:putative porin [Joostella atrarenae]MCF8714710.1 putative porin [Joostella atrarenae]
MKTYFFILSFLFQILVSAQNKALYFTGDFRFRIEQDWDSRKADGTYREDRTRLRYRARLGAFYNYNEIVSFGVRIRTGNPIKQQDPQLTLGDNSKEFGLLPIGFERIYAKFNTDWFSAWIGKNTFPFKKNTNYFGVITCFQRVSP